MLFKFVFICLLARYRFFNQVLFFYQLYFFWDWLVYILCLFLSYICPIRNSLYTNAINALLAKYCKYFLPKLSFIYIDINLFIYTSVSQIMVGGMSTRELCGEPVKNWRFCPGWCGSVDWVPACEPKGCMPGVQARSPVGGVWEATDWCISQASMFLSLPVSFPSPLKINKYNIFF